MNNLPKVVTQLLPRVGFESTTCRSQVQRSTPRLRFEPRPLSAPRSTAHESSCIKSRKSRQLLLAALVDGSFLSTEFRHCSHILVYPAYTIVYCCKRLHVYMFTRVHARIHASTFILATIKCLLASVCVFLPRDAMLSSCVCLSVCHKPVLCQKWLNAYHGGDCF